MLKLIKIRYARYPKVYELMKNRHITYNETLDYVEKEAESGKIFLIRPKEDSHIDRMEKDRDKLEALYEQGYSEASELYEELVAYLN